MKRRTLIKQLGIVLPSLSAAGCVSGRSPFAASGKVERIARGPFLPTWASLQTYQVPEWFRDAKFGMWAHWGPQCQPEAGDWYARGMYLEGSRQYHLHVQKYGHPSVFGFKDVIHQWKGEQWDPEALVALYKQSGARYFMAMANHHDNFDLYDSRHQPNWNATRIGPRKDIIGGWARAARNNGLPFGASIHASHAWSWLEPSQRSDTQGPFAGVPYDGNLTAADGKGKWWDGLDPQELYAQRHPLSRDSATVNGIIHRQWDWGNGVTPPTQAYIDKFYNRTIDLIDRYSPDLLYFDDSKVPLWPISDVGMRIAAHHYNHSIEQYGELRAIFNGKILDEDQRKAMVWDIERGQSNDIEPLPWQTDTCIGSWHYDRSVYDEKRYKSAKTVVQTLIDVVSKNGNLLLSVPVRGNGTIDELELSVIEDIGRWIKANGDSIYGTRPWTIFGEGPAQQGAAALSAQGFNEGKGKPFTAQDVRFVTKGDTLYATVMGVADQGKVTIKSLAAGSPLYPKEIHRVTWLAGGAPLPFERTADGLIVRFPELRPEDNYANVLHIV